MPEGHSLTRQLRLERRLAPPDTDLPAVGVMQTQPHLRLVSSADQLEALNHTSQETVAAETLQQPWQEWPGRLEEPCRWAAAHSYQVSMLLDRAAR